MPTKQLPGAGQLIKESWHSFIANWNDSVKASIWFLYIGLINFALALLSKVSPYFGVIAIPAAIGVAALALWAAIRTIQVVLDLEAGKKPDMSKKAVTNAWHLVLPMLWVAILEVVIIFGGFVVFIIPGIYLAIVLSFTNFLVIDQDARGLKALSGSRDLVKGRFWAVLWRVFAGSFVFGVGVMIATGVIFSVIAIIAGPSHFLSMNSVGQLEPLAQGTIDLLQSIVQAAILPLFVAYQVKMYRALKKTA